MTFHQNHRIKKGYKSLIKNTAIFFWNLLVSIKYIGKKKNILFYPEFPDWRSEIRKYTMACNYGMTSNINDKFDYVIYWEDTTTRAPNQDILYLSKSYQIINSNSIDISKEYVEEAFSRVFGYSSFIDPTVYTGLAVKKTNINGRHQWSEILCPIQKKEEGFVYQKLLNSKLTSDNLLRELRLYVIGNQLPFVIEENKSIYFRKVVEAQKYRLFDVKDVLTAEELDKIGYFLKEIKLDYGELDIIRDASDGRIYIIDVNNTPHLGNEKNFSKKDRQLKNSKFKEALLELLENKFQSIDAENKVKEENKFRSIC